MITIKDWLSSATKVLDSAQKDGKLDEYCNPKREAYYLMSYAINKNSAYLIAFGEEQLNNHSVNTLNTLLEKRAEGQPLAYILGIKEFWSLPLKVSPATLIPRADTECLVEKILTLYPDSPLEVLDLGTGTGAITFALASERNFWRFTAVDLVEHAVELANENKELLKETIIDIDRISFKQSNWFEKIRALNQFDIIVSNPPYIDKNDEHLLRGDARYEPKSALVADCNGLQDVFHIASLAKHYLKVGGKLFLEHGASQHKAIEACLLAEGYKNIQSHHDYNGKVRVTFADYSEK